MSLADLRDIVVIVYGVMGILLFLVLVIVAVAVFFTIRGLSRSVRRILEDPVRPTLEEVRQVVHEVRGSTEFWADHAVHPLIKVVATARGVSRGLGNVRGLTRRVRR
jgi:hypothetical protein